MRSQPRIADCTQKAEMCRDPLLSWWHVPLASEGPGRMMGGGRWWWGHLFIWPGGKSEE